MTYDAALWGALACALTALGLVLSYLAMRRRGILAGLRGLAWSILPIAAWLTGTLRLLAEILGDIGDWAVRLVFSPTVWLGVILAGVALVLFVGTGLLRRRRPRRERRVRGPKRSKALAHPRADEGGADEGMEGMDDIEAILRKHGIS